MLPAFNTPTGIPSVDVNLKTGEIRNPRTNPGKVGSLLIEFGALDAYFPGTLVLAGDIETATRGILKWERSFSTV